MFGIAGVAGFDLSEATVLDQVGWLRHRGRLQPVADHVGGRVNNGHGIRTHLTLEVFLRQEGW